MTYLTAISPRQDPIRQGALPSCTIIVCTRRRPQQLCRCLESLRRLDYPKSSVLVIENDDASTESEGIALSHGAGYRLCTRRGLSAARNLGVRISSSELVAFIDDDAVCEANWLSTSVPLFGIDRVLGVSGKVTFHTDGACASPPIQAFDPGNQIVGKDTPDWFGMANFGGLGLGSNFFIRRAAFHLVGGFDERLGRGSFINCWEENDFLFRIIDAGYRVATCSDSVVRHRILNPDVSHGFFLTGAAATSIVAMLAIEHPRYLPQLIRYVWEAAIRRPRPWRVRSSRLFDNPASRWTMYSALASGPFIYLSESLRHALSGTPHYTTTWTRGRQVRILPIAVPKQLPVRERSAHSPE